MSGSRPTPTERLLAEQHLGDRLSALVDGELGHDARERVLAHVATCPKCKTEVDAQRRLKNVFAEVAPPPPSESFLARLQGLPGGGDPDGGGSPLGGGGFGGFSPRASGGFGGRAGVFGVKRDDSFDFDFVSSGEHGPVLPPTSPDRGFRIHPVGRTDAERSASRGLRFAFVAAGAVSLAAVALGGVNTGAPGDSASEARGSGSGSNVTPARTPGTSAGATPENQRRRGLGPLAAQGGQGVLGETPVAPTAAGAPLLPGVPSPGTAQDVVHTLTTPVMAGAAAMSPLIRPLTAVTPIALTDWSSAPGVTAPGVLAAPVPGTTSTPSVSPLSR
ncbi:anti-sigma factor family protein [Streptomyces sp. NPDC002306]